MEEFFVTHMKAERKEKGMYGGRFLLLIVGHMVEFRERTWMEKKYSSGGSLLFDGVAWSPEMDESLDICCVEEWKGTSILGGGS